MSETKTDTTEAVERLRSATMPEYPIMPEVFIADVDAVCDALDQHQAEIAELTADLAGWKIAHGQKVDMLNEAEADRDRWRDNSKAKAAIISELTTELDRLTNGRWSSEIARLSHELITMTTERDHLRYIMQMPMQYVVLFKVLDKLQVERDRLRVENLEYDHALTIEREQTKRLRDQLTAKLAVADS